MLDILTRAGCFVSIIILGYLMKRVGIFKQEDFGVLAKVNIRLTLPCAIITSFAGRTIDPAMLSIPLLSIGFGLLYIAAGYFGNWNRSKEQRAFYMLNLPGYNIGSFVIPFVHSFLPPMSALAVSLFDTGNVFIALGGALSLALIVKDGKGFSLLRIGKTLIRSVPFVCYMIMLSLNLLHLSLPGFVLSVAKIGSDANAFMAMLMIGVGFRLEGKGSQVPTLLRLLAYRFGMATAFALLCFYALPFALEIRQALVLLVFSPICAPSVGFTQEIQGDVGLSSALNSLSILISITLTIILLLVML